MIKPIPKRLLPHTATYKGYVADTGEGESYSSVVTLAFIKIDEQTQLSRTKDGNEVIGNAIMYYDYVNSNGLVNKPLNNSIVTFKSRDYHIVDTDILYAESDTPHHYEVLLKWKLLII